MCLAIPGKVISVDKEKKIALIDQAGKKTEASTAVLEPKVGEWILVQAKLVLEVLSVEEAMHSLGK